MSKGYPVGRCRTCKSDIVQSVNEGVFRDGECEYCERRRYESQPLLLEACYAALELRCPDGDDHESGTFAVIQDAIQSAMGLPVERDRSFEPTRLSAIRE
jgi:hypothetical protein